MKALALLLLAATAQVAVAGQRDFRDLFNIGIRKNVCKNKKWKLLENKGGHGGCMSNMKWDKNNPPSLDVDGLFGDMDSMACQDLCCKVDGCKGVEWAAQCYFYYQWGYYQWGSTGMKDDQDKKCFIKRGRYDPKDKDSTSYKTLDGVCRPTKRMPLKGEDWSYNSRPFYYKKRGVRIFSAEQCKQICDRDKSCGAFVYDVNECDLQMDQIDYIDSKDDHETCFALQEEEPPKKLRPIPPKRPIKEPPKKPIKEPPKKEPPKKAIEEYEKKAIEEHHEELKETPKKGKKA